MGLVCQRNALKENAMRSKFLIICAAGAAILAAPLAASAQGSTDTKGNAMGSEQVGSGMKKATAPKKHSGTTGANTGTKGAKANQPAPTSTKGEVGPGGSNKQ